MQTGRIRQCIMYRMAQRCVDIMNVKNVETGFGVTDRTAASMSVLWGRAGYGSRTGRGDAGGSRKCRKLIQVVKGAEEVERMDTLLSLAVTGGDYAWI